MQCADLEHQHAHLEHYRLPEDVLVDYGALVAAHGYDHLWRAAGYLDWLILSLLVGLLIRLIPVLEDSQVGGGWYELRGHELESAVSVRDELGFDVRVDHFLAFVEGQGIHQRLQQRYDLVHWKESVGAHPRLQQL